MAGDRPTTVATCGGFAEGRRSPLAFAPLVHHAVELARMNGRAPRVSYLGTAFGDQKWFSSRILDASSNSGWDTTVLRPFPRPSVDDVEAHLLAQDVVWMGRGSVVNLMAVWRAHGHHEAFRRVWEAGVDLGGGERRLDLLACGRDQRLLGPELTPVVDGLGLLPFDNGVHYDAETGRRPLLQSLVADGTSPTTYATDDGVSLVYVGTELREAVTETPNALAYRVERGPDGEVETPITPRLLD